MSLMSNGMWACGPRRRLAMRLSEAWDAWRLKGLHPSIGLWRCRHCQLHDPQWKPSQSQFWAQMQGLQGARAERAESVRV
jgi:hypothetical protein